MILLLPLDCQNKRERTNVTVPTVWYIIMMTNWAGAMVGNPYGLFYCETDEEKAFVSKRWFASPFNFFRVGECAPRSNGPCYAFSWWPA